MRSAGFNTVTIGWYDAEMHGHAQATFWQDMDFVVKWADTLTDYVNGQDRPLGGPTFSDNQQGISTTWWRWGYRPGQLPDGTLNSDGTLKRDQYQVYWRWQAFSSQDAYADRQAVRRVTYRVFTNS